MAFSTFFLKSCERSLQISKNVWFRLLMFSFELCLVNIHLFGLSGLSQRVRITDVRSQCNMSSTLHLIFSIEVNIKTQCRRRTTDSYCTWSKIIVGIYEQPPFIVIFSVLNRYIPPRCFSDNKALHRLKQLSIKTLCFSDDSRFGQRIEMYARGKKNKQRNTNKFR